MIARAESLLEIVATGQSAHHVYRLADILCSGDGDTGR
jgi:hypothetical protein